MQDAKVAPAGSDLAMQLGISVGDPIFVSVFALSRGITNDPMPRSAVCIYSLQDIETKFNENIHMCFNGSTKYRNMGYVSGPIQDGKCPTAGVSLESDHCFGDLLNIHRIYLQSGTKSMKISEIVLSNLPDVLLKILNEFVKRLPSYNDFNLH